MIKIVGRYYDPHCGSQRAQGLMAGIISNHNERHLKKLNIKN